MTSVSLTISEVFDIALKSYYAGKLDTAEQMCLKILAADPLVFPEPVEPNAIVPSNESRTVHFLPFPQSRRGRSKDKSRGE